jgi:ubiquinone/menaquinone biosynthesis C-methylase UbiE
MLMLVTGRALEKPDVPVGRGKRFYLFNRFSPAIIIPVTFQELANYTGRHSMALTFEPFSDVMEYLNVNSRIIQRWYFTMREKGTHQIEKIVDLASGVGVMVQLFFENLPADWKKPIVTCVDRSVEALQLAQQRLSPLFSQNLEYICTAVENMTLCGQSTDVVTYGNGIHYLDTEKQQQVVERVHSSLKPGGWFFFNTAFYQESRPEWTLPFYQKKVKLAVKILRDRAVNREKQERRPTSADFLPRHYYEELVTANGFELEDVVEVEARLGQKAWEMISGYGEYAAGALHGFPLEQAAAALQEAIAPALAEHGRRDENGKLYITRNWLALAARAR